MEREICLIFDVGGTVDVWHRRGLLYREKRLFEELIRIGYAKKVHWMGYGSDDKKFERHFCTDMISIVRKPVKLHPFLYSFAMPFVQKEVFRNSQILRTVQTSAGWTALIAAKLYKKPLIVRSGYTWSLFAKHRNYAEPLDRLSLLVEHLLYRACDAAIVSTRSQKAYLVERYNIDKEKVFVVPNYVDTSMFRPLNTDGHANRIVFVGRVERQKNLANLIKALAGLDYELDIYGTGSERKNLENLANKLNVKVSFRGNVPNDQLPAIMNNYPIFVLPSLYEGMPKSLLEAMACGLAALSTDVSGINEIITHNENGWLVRPDVSSLQAGIQTLMTDGQLRRRLGDEARQLVRERYSLDSVVELECQVCDFALKRA
jgi:glycosyltransferase involved in cell wall biosynthesis